MMLHLHRTIMMAHASASCATQTYNTLDQSQTYNTLDQALWIKISMLGHKDSLLGTVLAEPAISQFLNRSGAKIVNQWGNFANYCFE
jgi:hypothetical protein